MSGWETRIATGNQETDRQVVEQHRQAAAAQGLQFDAQPLPGGGFAVRAFPAPAYAPQAQPGYGASQPQPGYGAPQGQQGYGAPQAQPGYGGASSHAPQPCPQAQPGYGGASSHAPQAQPGYGGASSHASSGGAWGQPAYAGGASYSAAASAGGVLVGGRSAAPALTDARVQYIRKVYGLLTGSVLLACLAGFATVTMGDKVWLRSPEGYRVAVPLLTALMLQSRGVMLAAFGLLFVATLAASAVTKVRGLNVVALFGVAALMGVEVAPMVFVAQFYAGMGKTLSSAPVADTFMVVGAVFIGATSYAFITRKDFSYLMATLSMGFWVVFVGCIVAAFIDSNIFSLAIASVGAIVAAGLLLVTTGRVFAGPMDDAVGDCLSLLVQLRNLFVFLLRIFMNSRR